MCHTHVKLFSVAISRISAAIYTVNPIMNIENTRLALNREKFMLRGLERREREPWRALSVFEPSNINFSLFNANPSILFIPSIFLVVNYFVFNL